MLIERGVRSASRKPACAWEPLAQFAMACAVLWLLMAPSKLRHSMDIFPLPQATDTVAEW